MFSLIHSNDGWWADRYLAWENESVKAYYVVSVFKVVLVGALSLIRSVNLVWFSCPDVECGMQYSGVWLFRIFFSRLHRRYKHTSYRCLTFLHPNFLTPGKWEGHWSRPNSVRAPVTSADVVKFPTNIATTNLLWTLVYDESSAATRNYTDRSHSVKGKKHL